MGTEQSVPILNTREELHMQKTEFYFPSSDEIHDIHAIVWKPEGDVRALVQISHGMIEYVDRYEELAEYLTARGILVF